VSPRQVQRSGRPVNVRTGRRPTLGTVILALLLAVVSVAGCQTSTADQSAGSGAGLPAETKALFEAQQGPLSWEAPGPALTAGSVAEGASLYLIVDVANLPFTQRLIGGTKAAAEAVGMSVTVVQHQFDPSEAARLIQQGVNNHASVIAVEGFSGAQLQAPLKAAQDAGVITMTVITTPDPGPLSPEDQAAGLFAHVTYCQTCLGAQMAVATAGLSQGQAHVGLVYTGDYPSAALFRDGFKAELAKVCPGCTYAERSVPTATYTTTVGPATSSLLSDPSIDYLVGVFDALEVYMEPAIAAGGATDRVRIVTNDADEPQMQSLKDGGLVAADIGEEVEKIGWGIVDQSLRGMLDLPPSPDEKIGGRTFTADNIGEIDLTADPVTWYGAPGYAEKYRELWGLP
jgi:ABC-type sugar transport system substrate-binding protein